MTVTDSICTVHFTILGKAVGKNAAYTRLRRDLVGAGGRRRGLILSQAGRAFKERVGGVGLANRPSEWPKDLRVPKRVRVTVAMHGSRHDASACTQLVKDALEKIYYANDRIVEHGPEGPADPKSLPARVEITVELLDVRSPAELAKMGNSCSKRML